MKMKQHHRAKGGKGCCAVCVWGVGRLGENVFSPVSPTQLISAAVL